MVVALLGPPWVRIRTVSKTLKELIVRIIKVKNSWGEIMGRVILKKITTLLA